MKKFFLFAALFAAMTMNATDLFTGSKHVSWIDGGLQIEAAKFADAQPGQKIVLTVMPSLSSLPSSNSTLVAVKFAPISSKP